MGINQSNVILPIIGGTGADTSAMVPITCNPDENTGYIVEGSLSNVVYGTNGPTSWTEGTVDYTATYNSDGTLAAVTGGGAVKTFTYSAGQLTSVTTGAV